MIENLDIEGDIPTNHFRKDSLANECLTTYAV